MTESARPRGTGTCENDMCREVKQYWDYDGNLLAENDPCTKEKGITASEFSKIIAEMIKSEKEVFKDFIEREDWEALEDEVFEYARLGE